MHTTPTLMLALALALSASAQAQEISLTEQQAALQDWERLAKLSEQVTQAIHAYTPNGPYGGAIRERHAEHLEAIESYQRDVQPEVDAQLAAFEATYGASSEALAARWEQLFPTQTVYQLPDAIRGDYDRLSTEYPDPERLLREIRQELAGLKATRVETADGIVTQAAPALKRVESLGPLEASRERIRLAEELGFAVRFDPDNAEARRLLDSLGGGEAGSADTPAESGGVSLGALGFGACACVIVLVFAIAAVVAVALRQRKAAAPPAPPA